MFLTNQALLVAIFELILSASQANTTNLLDERGPVLYRASDQNDEIHVENEFNDRLVRSRRQSKIGCPIPQNTPNGTYNIHGPTPVDEQLAAHGSILILTCSPGYGLVKSVVNFCDPKKNDWFEVLAECQKNCKPPKSLTVDFTCVQTKNGHFIRESCGSEQSSGATAIGECREGHHSISFNRYITCMDGRWGHTMPSCKPQCGQSTSSEISSIKNGINAVRGEFPWHVAIYIHDGQEESGMMPKLWCAGSIISRSLVITAAHCFYHSMAKQKLDASIFTVTAGKLYRDLDHHKETMDTSIQISGIKRIEIPEYYDGDSSNNTYDLALLVMENPFNFTDAVMPVCLNLLDKDFDEEQSSAGSYGKVAGFGLRRANKDVSDVLKSSVMSITSKTRCRSNSQTQFLKYIVWDKLCAGNINVDICREDSGGGLVVSNLEKKIPIWYLRGVVSTSQVSTSASDGDWQCSTNTYSIFTRPFAHKQFIENVIHNQGCVIPSNPSNGEFKLDGLRSAEPGETVAYGSKMELKCDEGFVASDSEMNVCDEFTDNWINELASCGDVASNGQTPSLANHCVMPDHPNNGIYTVLNMDSIKPGDLLPPSTIITVTCLPGYTLSSDVNTTTCDGKSKTWKEEIATCEDYYKIVCYFTNWAMYRKGIGKFLPEDIDPDLCTHIIYSFAILDNETLLITVHDAWADLYSDVYKRVTALKNKGIKVSLSLGGWEDSSGDKYSRLVNDPAARKKFVEHAVSYLQEHNFDGLDLHWKYPTCWQAVCSTGPPSDKDSYASWARELKEAFRPHGFLLSASVASVKYLIDASYDVPSLSTHMDWINLITYDYHGQWEKKTGHGAPLYSHPEDYLGIFNANFSINYWIEKGASPRKLVMGIPIYGRSFTLDLDSNTKLGQNDGKNKFGINFPAKAGGEAGEYTKSNGFLSYYEVCDRIKNRGWTVVQDENGNMGPYAYKDDQWVSFDDKDIIRKKMEYLKSLDLGGAMIWALDFDDFNNTCGEGAYPLLSEINDVLRNKTNGDSSQSGENVLVVTPKPSPKPIEVVTPVTMKSTDNEVTPTKNANQKYKMVCYFTNWSWYRGSTGKYIPDDINSSLCTHIVYGYAKLDEKSLTIKALDPWADIDNRFYERVTAHKNKGTMVLLAMGGWNESEGDKYSRLVNNPDARKRFANHAMNFIIKNNFDGLNLGWVYPVCWQGDCNKGPPSDKEGFATFVKELCQLFATKNLLVSATVSSNIKVINDAYDVEEISSNLDWIGVMSYDYHGQWEKKTGHIAPLYARPDDDNKFLNVNASISHWISKGAAPSKLLIGLPMYGKSWTLKDSNDHDLNSPAEGGGKAGDISGAVGTLSYYEICDRVRNQHWVVQRDTDGSIGPFAYNGDQWVSFDDVAMIKMKIAYLKSMGLGGGMMWTLDYDDFHGTCGCEAYPLLSAAARDLGLIQTPQPNCDINSIPVSVPDATSVKSLSTQVMPTSTQPTVISSSESEESMFMITPTPDPRPVNAMTTLTMEAGNDEVPLSKQPKSPYKLVCYFTSWASYRGGAGKYFPRDINSTLCTHIVYAFASLDEESLTIKSFDPKADIENKFYEKVTANKNTGTKVLLAIGGWNDSEGDKYSRMVNNPDARKRFVDHAMKFIIDNNFDGLNLDWEYPVCWQGDCIKGPSSDKENFIALVKELREVFATRNLLVSATVSANVDVINRAYNVKELSSNVDWIAVMNYDYHGQWERRTGHIAPLYVHPDDGNKFLNVNATINHWISKGAAPSKLLMGMPLYGRSWTLEDPDEHDLNSPADGGGEPGSSTNTTGTLSYYEICDRLKNYEWQEEKDIDGLMGPFAYRGDQWVSFDNVAMIRMKIAYLKSMGLGGGMVWALDLDDFRGSCGCEPYPLLSAAARDLELIQTPHLNCDAKYGPVLSNQPTQATISEILPVTSSGPSDHKVICYYNSMAWSRNGEGKYKPEDIDTSLCTHVIYGFAVLNFTELIIVPKDYWTDIDNGLYEKVIELKDRGTKVLISIGGWLDSSGEKYSRLVNNPDFRANFIAKAIDFIEKWQFDGLDLDWEYPKCWQIDCNAGPVSDKFNFAKLVQELREKFTTRGWLLSAAVSASVRVINLAYDVPTLAANLDWISVMAYDYHRYMDKMTSHVAPLYLSPGDDYDYFTVNASMNYWIKQGAPARKLVMGMSFFGRSFRLRNPSESGLGAAISGLGEKGEFTDDTGVLAYYEICERVKHREWSVNRNEQVGPWAVKVNQWVSFDDTRAVATKVELAKSLGLGGVMVWSLDLDDFQNRCGCGKYPLLRAVNAALKKTQLPTCDL